MSQQTLKELLKPPFEIDMNCEGGIPKIYLDGNDKTYWVKVTTCRHDNRNNAIDNQLKENADWVVAALNEKWERDFGERKQWQKHTLFNPASQNSHSWYDCPYCGQLAGENGLTNYCPHCGQPLDPPEEIK
jgi:rubrerythrin